MQRITLIVGLLLAVLVLPWRSSAFAADDFAAHDDDIDLDRIVGAEAPPEYRESPQYVAVEIKLGPYSPDIDSEFGGTATPFNDIFGSGTAISFRGEIDLQLWHGFGNVGVGFGAGYYSKGAKPFADDGSDTIGSGDLPGTPADKNGPRVAGTTELNLIPLSLLAVYRFDVLNKRFDIPLVPFVKGGINYTLWEIKSSDGSTAKFQGDKASGGTWGWQLNAGVAFVLDVIDRSAAKTMDVEVGVNHSYLFFELMHMKADNFGGDGLNVGDTTYFGGLAFEI